MLFTFWVTLVAWTFFRAESVEHALQYASGLVPWAWTVGTAYDARGAVPGLVYILVVVVAEWLQRDRDHALCIERLPRVVRWLVYVTVGLAVAFLGSLTETDFIYFQF